MSHIQEDLGDLTPKDFNKNKGVNIGTLLLVLLVLVIVSLFSAYILYLVFGTDMLMDHSGDIINGLTCDKSNLIDASTAPCCAGQGNFIVSDIRYLADIDMTVGTNPQEYETVCRGYCSSFTGSGCTNADDDVNYQKCIADLKPANCNGLAMPVAQIGSQRYYGQNAGYQADAFCSTRCVCGLSTCQVVS